MSEASILLIEDEPDVMRSNRIALELEGYRVLEADTLAKGREMVKLENPDLILLDILLPDGNGLDYCRELRGVSGVRILFLSALNEKEDVIVGLRAGGDDYIHKPYLMEELLVRVETLLRRGWLIDAVESDRNLRVGSLEFNYTHCTVGLNGKLCILAKKEMDILQYLARNADRYVTAKELYEKVWGMKTADDVRTVKEHIRRIRLKSGNDAPFSVKSLQGRGYRFIEKQ